MKNVKVVIGANFGDEGKGLMTDYFSYEAKKNKKSCIVVCHNGGAQKGHTVVTKDVPKNAIVCGNPMRVINTIAR